MEIDLNDGRLSSVIDLNADLGESFGVYRLGQDEALLAVVTSANIACGIHAGDPTTLRKAVAQALAADVQVGAHPGLPDRVGFGRRNMDLSPDEAFDLVLYQVSALWGVTRALGGALSHVKPHGALYNMAASDSKLADAIAQAVAQVDAGVALVGLAGTELLASAKRHGLQARSEVFADRRYRADGSLVPRRDANALIDDSQEAVAQAVRMARAGVVTAVTGEEIEVEADTLCIHGDGLHALQFAKEVKAALTASGVVVGAPKRA